LIGIVNIDGGFPRAVVLFLPNDYVFAFHVACFALLVGGEEIVGAGLVG
jgi:hypothetical protein